MITAGYTGTEGYGITITQSVGGRIRNVTIRDVETHHGAANGIALFKDSSVEFDGVNVDGITAGSRLNAEQLRPEMDYLPNKVPIACSIFDNEYGTEWTLTNEVVATNVRGFLVCDGDAMIGECDGSCTAQFDRAYFDGLREAAVAAEVERQRSISWALSSMMEKSMSARARDIGWRGQVHLLSVALIISSVSAIIVVGVFQFVKWTSSRKLCKENDGDGGGDWEERMPLLVH